jgi:hypothetical protein
MPRKAAETRHPCQGERDMADGLPATPFRLSH